MLLPTTTPRLCSALARAATGRAMCRDPTLSTCLMDESSMSATTPMATTVLWLMLPTMERLTTPLPPNTTPLHPSTMLLHPTTTPLLRSTMLQHLHTTLQLRSTTPLLPLTSLPLSL